MPLILQKEIRMCCDYENRVARCIETVLREQSITIAASANHFFSSPLLERAPGDNNSSPQESQGQNSLSFQKRDGVNS